MLEICKIREDEQAWQKPLQELFGEFGVQMVSEDTLLQDMPFNVRCHNCLRQAGLKTLAMLNSTSITELMSIRAFGWGTMEQLMETYASTFSQTTFDFPESEMSYIALSYESALGHELSLSQRSYPVAALPLSTRSLNTLKALSVKTVGQLLSLSPQDIQSLGKVGPKTLDNIEQCIQQFVTSPSELETALTQEPELLEISYQPLDSFDVAWSLSYLQGQIAPVDSTTPLSVNFSSHQIFESYSSLLVTVIEQCIRSPRRREAFIEYYGLFSAPLGRIELAQKLGVTPTRIYQMLTMTERTRDRFIALGAVFSAPILSLLKQHGGILSLAALERGLAEHFKNSIGKVRVEGILEILAEYPEMASELTVLREQQKALALIAPVTVAAVKTLVSELYEELTSSPDGLEEEEIERLTERYWARVIPGYPKPDVAAIDIAWLNPKIVIENKIWRIWRRRSKPRVTNRLTLVGLMEEVLTRNGRPMPVQDLFAACRERIGEINVPAYRTALLKNEDIFRSFGRGIYGLVHWEEFTASEVEEIRILSRRSNPRTLRDKIEVVLEETGIPMSFQSLFRELQIRFEDIDDRGVRCALLLSPERFQAHGNGIYGLTEWGEDAVSILEEAASGFLEQRGYPASETEICDGLRDQFPLSIPVCRWVLRQAWERSGTIVPLDGALWDIADVNPVALNQSGVSAEDLLLEQLLSC